MEFTKVLVPVDGSGADEEAVALACRLAKPDKAGIIAVYVIPIDRTLPLDAEIETEVQKAEAILDRMEATARELGCRLETDLLQARDAAPAIIDEAVEREADLIVMASAYQQRFGQFSLGDLIPHVLKHAPCEVILYHHQAP
jgi:nucleotide-binding universal stress UspA family protein